MKIEDMINITASSNSASEGQNNTEQLGSENEQHEVNSGKWNSENREGIEGMEEDMDLTEDDYRAVHGQFGGVTEQASAVQATVESVTTIDAELNIQNEGHIYGTSMDAKSGVKRPRPSSDEVQPSVHVSYKNLTRASKQKLEQLLQQWSEWEGEHGSSTQEQDQDQGPESGEETYFPALHVGLEKTSSVSFWIDNHTGNKQIKGFVPVDSSTVPFYDRRFSLGLTSEDGSNNLEGRLEIIDDPPRCFNCGSYSHSLRECSKPRDNAAVNSARKLHKAKRNQNPGSRLPARYYQSSQCGKFEGLRPGVLGAETRQLLGLRELDPPPWLNRMREIGYPPGYLGPDDENCESGITIFGEDDNDVKEEETEDGEILEKRNVPEPPKKMTVEFPGMNAPIPENADEKLWAPESSSNSDAYRNRWQNRSSRGYFHEPRPYRDYRHDGPLGLEPSSYPPRYGGGYDCGYCPKDDNISRFRSPTFERSQSYGYSRYSSSSPSSSSRNRDYDLDFRDRDDYESYRHRSSRR